MAKKNVEKKVVTLKVADIKTNPKNEKVHTAENLALIRQSLNDIGYVTPIIVDDGNMILAGHGRFEVMKEDGETEIEVVKLTGLKQVQKDKFRIYDNQTARTGHYDNELLVETVEGILGADADFNISILNIDGLVEAFSDDILSFDIGKATLNEIKVQKNKVLVVFSDDVEKLKQLLDSKSYEYVEGAENETK